MTDFVHNISDEIYFIEGQRQGRYPYAHSLLIEDSIFDTGISSGFLRKLKRKYPIKNVFLSHWHEDHISGNRLLPNAKFFAHAEDIPVIEDIQKMNEYYLVADDPEQVELYAMILEGMRLQDTKVDNTIEDNQIISIGTDYKVKVIETPGHTNGHCCFYEMNSKVAFLADIDLSSFGPWYAGIDSSIIKFEESIINMKNIDIEVAVTSHKGLITGKKNIREGLDNYLNVIHERDRKILEHFSENKPVSAEDLGNLNLIYGHYSEFALYEVMAEKIMIQYHFDKLEKTGKIEKKDKGYILS